MTSPANGVGDGAADRTIPHDLHFFLLIKAIIVQILRQVVMPVHPTTHHGVVDRVVMPVRVHHFFWSEFSIPGSCWLLFAFFFAVFPLLASAFTRAELLAHAYGEN